MKITGAEAGSIKILSKFLKFGIFLSQVLVPVIHAYKTISVTIDHSYRTLQGSVYVSIDGKVGKICTYSSDWNIASVVCRELGHGPPITANSVYDFAAPTNMYYKQNFPCKGDETSLSECYNNDHSYYTFCSNYFLEVECLPSSDQNFNVHLVGGSTFSMYGIVLASYGYRWGTICSNNDIYLPDAVCKQLGYFSGNYYYFNYDDGFKNYEDPVLYINGCDYWDTSLDDCSYTAWSSLYSGCSPVAVECSYNDFDEQDSSYDVTTSADGMAAGFSVMFFFLIIMCCTGVICCLLCRKKNRQPREQVVMSNVTSGATAPLQPQEPVVHPPPPPYKDVVVGPTTDEPPPPVYHPSMGYPPASGPGYPPAPGPGYNPASGPGYPAANPGYPSAPVYPSAPASGHPPAPVPGHQPGPGYPPAPGPGYPPAPGPGYPPAPGPGYPTAPGPEHLAVGSSYPTATDAGYPSASGSGYPPASDPGNLPPKSSGYLPGSGTDYQSAPPPSFAPTADYSSSMGQTDGGPPLAGEQSGPSPSAPPPPDVPSPNE